MATFQPTQIRPGPNAMLDLNVQQTGPVMPPSYHQIESEGLQRDMARQQVESNRMDLDEKARLNKQAEMAAEAEAEVKAYMKAGLLQGRDPFELMREMAVMDGDPEKVAELDAAVQSMSLEELDRERQAIFDSMKIETHQNAMEQSAYDRSQRPILEQRAKEKHDQSMRTTPKFIPGYNEDGSQYQQAVDPYSGNALYRVEQGTKPQANPGVVVNTGDQASTRPPAPKLPTGEQAYWDEQAGGWAARPVPGSSAENLNVSQGAAATYADRAAHANAVLDSPSSDGQPLENVGTHLTEKIRAGIPVLGNYLVSEDHQKLDQAQRNFINAILRRESGAVIAESEFMNARKQYFPQPGDSPDVIAQKRQNRMDAMAGLQRDAGNRYTPDQPANAFNAAPYPEPQEVRGGGPIPAANAMERPAARVDLPPYNNLAPDAPPMGAGRCGHGRMGDALE